MKRITLLLLVVWFFAVSGSFAENKRNPSLDMIVQKHTARGISYVKLYNPYSRTVYCTISSTAGVYHSLTMAGAYKYRKTPGSLWYKVGYTNQKFFWKYYCR